MSIKDLKEYSLTKSLEDTINEVFDDEYGDQLFEDNNDEISTNCGILGEESFLMFEVGHDLASAEHAANLIALSITDAITLEDEAKKEEGKDEKKSTGDRNIFLRAWDWIVELFKKIGRAIKNFFVAILNFFKRLFGMKVDEQKLKTLSAEAEAAIKEIVEKEGTDIESRKIKVVSPGNSDKVANEIIKFNETYNKIIGQDANKLLNNIKSKKTDTVIEDSEKIRKEIDEMSADIESSIKNNTEDLTKSNFEKFIKSSVEDAKNISSHQSARKITASLDKSQKEFNKTVKNIESVKVKAKGWFGSKEIKDATDACRKLGSDLNKVSAIFKYCRYYMSSESLSTRYVIKVVNLAEKKEKEDK